VKAVLESVYTLDEYPPEMVNFLRIKHILRKEARFMLNQVIVLVPQAAWARLSFQGLVQTS